MNEPEITRAIDVFLVMARLAVCAWLLALVASTLARDTSPHAIHAKQVAAGRGPRAARAERKRNSLRAKIQVLRAPEQAGAAGAPGSGGGGWLGRRS